MESNLKIPTQDGKVIYARLRGPLNQPLAVFVHGLGGRMDQHIFYNGARFLEKHGISSFRFNLYSWEKDARNLSDCTIETHASDLDLVIDYLKKGGAKRIFVIGHSFGGPTILLSKKKNFDGVILWDPSYAKPLSFKDAEYVDCLDMYKARWEFEILFSKAMIEEEKTLKRREEAAIAEIKVPVKVITAGNGLLIEEGKDILSWQMNQRNMSLLKEPDTVLMRREQKRGYLKKPFPGLTNLCKYRNDGGGSGQGHQDHHQPAKSCG